MVNPIPDVHSVSHVLSAYVGMAASSQEYTTVEEYRSDLMARIVNASNELRAIDPREADVALLSLKEWNEDLYHETIVYSLNKIIELQGDPK